MQVANSQPSPTLDGLPPTLTATEIAALLRVKTATFLKNRKRMAAAGFPRPLPTGGRPVWSRALVLAWIAAGGDVQEEAPADPIAAARTALEARIGGAA